MSFKLPHKGTVKKKPSLWECSINELGNLSSVVYWQKNLRPNKPGKWKDLNYIMFN